MAELLESTMLLCFGLSWPISVVKNIKAKTAKSTSLPFILLIITGYVAGIAAKFYSHRINYVLAVYIINIVMVTANLIVYFINKRYDRLAEMSAAAEASSTDIQPETVTDTFLQAEITEREISETEHDLQQAERSIMDNYRELNTITEPGGIILFGSDYFSSIPHSELAHSFHMDVPIYNRSIKDMSIDNVQSYMDVCLFDLQPQKIFVNIGESDMKNPNFDIDSFISKYEWMLYTIHTKTNAEIFIVSIISNQPIAAQINARLKSLAAQSGCRYIDAVSALASDRPMLRVFEQLKFYFRTSPISLSDAMDMVTIGNQTPEDEVRKSSSKRVLPHHRVSYAK